MQAVRFRPVVDDRNSNPMIGTNQVISSVNSIFETKKKLPIEVQFRILYTRYEAVLHEVA